MTREDIDDIINAICPNDEDYEKPCISPKYLRQELEQLALDQRQWDGESTTKNNEDIMTINNKELASDLITLAIMCANEETDNCDIILTTSKGKINCHIEFNGVEDGKID